MSDDTLKRLIELGVNGTPAIREMQNIAKEAAKTTEGIEGIQKQLDGFAAGIKGAFTGLGIGAAVDQAISGVRNMIDAFDQLGKSAQVAGTSVEKLQELQFALKLGAGLDSGEATQALTRFSDKLADINNKSSDAARVMREMGLQAGDTADGGLRKIAEAFSNANDGVNKTAIATELFGRSLGAKMIPFLNQGAKGIDDLNDELKKLGGTVSGDVAEQAGKFNDNLTKLAQNSRGLGVAITTGLLPYLNDLTSFLVKNIEAGTLWSGMWQRFKDNWKDNEILLHRAAGQSMGPTNLELREQTSRLDDYAAKMKGYAEQVSRMKSATDLPPAHIEKIKAAGKAAAQTKSDFEAWMDSMLKMKTATDDSGAKIAWLESHLAALAATGDTSSEVFKKWTAELRKLAPDAVADALDKINKSAKELDTAPAVIAGIKKELVEMTLAGDGASVAAVKLHDKLLELEAATDPAKAVTLELKKINAELAKNAEMESQWFNALATGQASSAAFAKGVNKYLDDTQSKLDKTTEKTKTLGDAVEEMGAKFVTDFIDQMVDGFGKADQSFEDMITSMIKQLAKLIIQMQAAQFIKDAGGTSGWFSGLSGIFSGGGSSKSAPASNDDLMAGGGILARGSVSLHAGDSSTTSSSSPSSAQGATFAASPVTVNINNSTDSQVRATSKDNADGTRQIDIYVERKVREMVASGALDRSMRSSYGVSRQPAAG